LKQRRVQSLRHTSEALCIQSLRTLAQRHAIRKHTAIAIRGIRSGLIARIWFGIK
jgi:hypothetical protein